MSMDIGEAESGSGPHLRVWDSQYGPATEAFSIFRETICREFMPWTPEFSGSDFRGRVESVALSHGSIGRVRMSPIIARKTKRDIGDSPVECIHGNFILSGELKVDQAGSCNIAKAGDLVLYHSHSPVTLTERPDTPCDNLAFIIPRSQFSAIPNAVDHFGNNLLSTGKLIEPLAACLAQMAKSLRSTSVAELSALLDACIALLPLSAGCFDDQKSQFEIAKSSYLLRQLLDFIEENISDPDLSPGQAADHLGISVRYVHKLFAHSGTTFSAYVMAERLEHIRSELIALVGRRSTISALAFRWGFNEISTFNKAFKARFGVSPRQFR